MLAFLRIIGLAVSSWIVSAVAIYRVALWLAPPRTADGHPVMPIGQVVFAGLGATLIAVALIAVLVVRHRRRSASRRRGLVIMFERQPAAEGRVTPP